jgi:predicted small secreted protein
MFKKLGLTVVVVFCATIGCSSREYMRKPDMPMFSQSFNPDIQVFFCNPLRGVGTEDMDRIGKAWGYRFNNGIPFVEPFPGAKGNSQHKFITEE